MIAIAAQHRKAADKRRGDGRQIGGEGMEGTGKGRRRSTEDQTEGNERNKRTWVNGIQGSDWVGR